jgi:hypothetical protein
MHKFNQELHKKLAELLGLRRGMSAGRCRPPELHYRTSIPFLLRALRAVLVAADIMKAIAWASLLMPWAARRLSDCPYIPQPDS